MAVCSTSRIFQETWAKRSHWTEWYLLPTFQWVRTWMPVGGRGTHWIWRTPKSRPRYLEHCISENLWRTSLLPWLIGVGKLLALGWRLGSKSRRPLHSQLCSAWKRREWPSGTMLSLFLEPAAEAGFRHFTCACTSVVLNLISNFEL